LPTKLTQRLFRTPVAVTVYGAGAVAGSLGYALALALVEAEWIRDSGGGTSCQVRTCVGDHEVRSGPGAAIHDIISRLTPAHRSMAK
jgi:hypothetical protein